MSMFSVLILAAAVQAEPPVEAAPAPQLVVAYTTRAPAGFVAATAGKAGFAMLGAAAMIADGERITAVNGISDPAGAMSKALAEHFAETHSAAVREAPLAVKGGKPVQIATAAGEARYVVDVQTLGWGFSYFPMDWSHFAVGYRAKLRVVDVQTKKSLAEDICAWDSGKNNAPTQAELLSDGARGLKERIATASDTCLQQFRAKIDALPSA